MRNIVQSAKCKVQSKGFTLIELLVVISIIGILATLLISRYGMAEKSARDTQRKSDLSQYRNALENYVIKTGGVYPSYIVAEGIQASITLYSKLGATYISSPLEDPLYDETDNPNRYYRYLSNGDTGNGVNEATQYILWAAIETGAQPNYWYICANGKSGEKSAPAAADCNF